MRLLESGPDGCVRLKIFQDIDLPRYAVLSHTWIAGQEVTFEDYKNETGQDNAGCNKIRFCVNQAAADGIHYSWVDTCCIDKSTSEELNTAINSMFRWYQGAAKCYVYLSDVEAPANIADASEYPIAWVDQFRRSRWFTRGWTLQELLAPVSVEFFSKEGKYLGNKRTLEAAISDMTRIPVKALRASNLSEFSVEDRFRWATGRNTMVPEDKAYCLLGIFGIFLPLIYGEGEEHALQRVRDEIRRRQHDNDERQGSGVHNVNRGTGTQKNYSQIGGSGNRQFNAETITFGAGGW